MRSTIKLLMLVATIGCIPFQLVASTEPKSSAGVTVGDGLGPTAQPTRESDAEKSEGQIKMAEQQARNQGIVSAPVTSGVIARHLQVPGTVAVDPDRIARVPARVVGTVAEMRKRLGELVARGEVVAVLDSREVADAKSEYLTASVRADLEKINSDRQQALWDKRISSESTLLNAKAVYAEAVLRQDLARQKLSALGLDAGEVARQAKQDEKSQTQSSLRLYELRSPIAGRVVERKVDVGASVGKEGDPPDLYTVADLSAVWVELAVPTGDLGQVKEGAKVVITPNQGSGDSQPAEGKVMFVSPLLNLETRSARVIVSLPNVNLAWRPGTFVTAEIQTSHDTVQAVAPKRALQTMAGKRAVFVQTPEGFQMRHVETGRSDDNSVELTSGVKAGERIAVENTFLLKAELGKGEAEHGH